jgi:leucyl-tRNA synthetase
MTTTPQTAAYDFAAIEKKWQDYWAAHQTFRALNPGEPGFDPAKPKLYVLDMFPYPSGAGLHVGHPEGYTATDIVSRYARMRGYNVLHPMGYDSFGLPAQQYAVEHGIHPRVTTERNIANIERQIKMLGFSYDWSRRLATTDPDYYRWTQWIFLQMFDAWYDPEAVWTDPSGRKIRGRARRIAELIKELESGARLVDAGYNAVPAPCGTAAPGCAAAPGATGSLPASASPVPPGLRRWSDLNEQERRQVIDNHRLAVMADVPVNWCPGLGTVLANEEVTNEGRSDRGDFPVYRRPMRQWMLRITRYADRLMDDLAMCDWPESIKIMQRNWIGRSEGAEVDFLLAGDAATDDTQSYNTFDAFKAARAAHGYPVTPGPDVIRIYTTRPDTLFGATYMVLAPEHPLVEKITTADRRADVQAYVSQAAGRSELERVADAKAKSGVFTGAYAVNPVNDAQIPIWVADYVLMSYGTGAIMAVPAHDTRDFEFARQFGLPITAVVKPTPDAVQKEYPDDPTPPERMVEEVLAGTRCFVGDGVAINSARYDGQTTAQFQQNVTRDLAAVGLGRFAVNYKLRDWLFSRQWYWGEPFPIVHCADCGAVALPEGQLPLVLPELEDFKPKASDDPNAPPQPPLARITDWVRTTCPKCGRAAEREVNTMPQWAGSCWYYLRYLDPRNDKALVDRQVERYWMAAGGLPAWKKTDEQKAGGVDLYIGGAEHAVLHLLYARFWHKVLFDLGYVSTPEPFAKLFNQGMIRGFAYRDSRGMYVSYDQIDFREDGAYHKQTGEKLAESIEKMSKSLKNVVTPDEVVNQYGADTLRLYEMYMGPLEASKPWNTRDVMGVHRFLHRAWRLIVDPQTGALSPAVRDVEPDADALRVLHEAIKEVTEDIENLRFNTAIAALIVFVNEMTGRDVRPVAVLRPFLLLLAPFAPHVAEELWQRLAGAGWKGSLACEPWPVYDPALARRDQIEVAVQINGKVRTRLTVSADADAKGLEAAALADAKVKELIGRKQVRKVIAVPGRLVNIVVG